MKQKRFLGFLPAFFLLALPVLVHGQSSMSLPDTAGEFGEVVEVSVTLTTDQETQGVVAVGELDASIATITGLAVGADLEAIGPDTVVLTIGDDASYFVLGSVFDSDPNDNDGIAEVLGPGENLAVATVSVLCGSGTETVTTPFAFVDGAHPAAMGGPALDNVIVVGGLSIGATEGLGLNDGSVTCEPTPDRLTIEGGEIEGSNGTINVLLNNNEEVEGFVIAVCHDDAVLALTDISIGPDAAQADFSAVEIEAGGGAMGVVIDLVDPMADPPNIDPGLGHEIAILSYRCLVTPGTGDDPIDGGVQFCDGAVGAPLKDNLIVIGGLSKTAADGLRLTNNPVLCVPVQGEIPPRETICDDGIDNDLDGLIDLEDPDCQNFDFEFAHADTLEVIVEPDGLEAHPGGAPVMLMYNAPDSRVIGGGGDVLDGEAHVSAQGFSLALSFICGDLSIDNTFDISGTILESVGAEFIGVQPDNSADDGDDCSLVLAVLVDALPPFDGVVIPGLATTQAMGILTIHAEPGLACDAETVLTKEDGVNGLGKVPVFNLISVDNLPYPATVRDLGIIARGTPVFYRGDCNFTNRARFGLDPVEIADSAAIISYLFQRSIFKFDPPCLDACDANDDGRIDLADAIGVLNYLFIPGSSFPPAPGPGYDEDINVTGPGIDPTEDPLDCAAGDACDI